MLAILPVESVVFATVLGLIVGSFLSMLTWRWPRILHLTASEQLRRLSFSRSACPKCNTPLPWYRLIPLFSWLWGRGKCHHCNAPIAWRYPAIELVTALLSAVWVYHTGVSWLALYGLIFLWMLLAIAIIDIEHQLILDALSLPLLWLGLILNTQQLFTTPEQAILGAATGYLVLWTIFQTFKWLTGKEGMGYGDFKLLAALGAWFGVLAIPQIILIASISSLIVGLLLVALKQRRFDSPLPFGPFLALGGWVSLMFGNELIQQL